MGDAAKGPCTECAHQPNCRAFEVLDPSLFTGRRFLQPRPLDDVDIALDALVGTFVETLRTEACAAWTTRGSVGVYLSALFDLAVNGLYLAGLVNSSGEFTQQALGCGPNTAFFPFVWMCPACVADEQKELGSCYLPGARREDGRDYPRQELLAKPGGRAIGDAGIKVLRAILRATLAKTRPQAVMREGGGTHGEFDLTFSDPSVLVFAEVKAKPLVSYPMRLHGPTGLAEGEHKWMDSRVTANTKADLYLAATGEALALSLPDGSATWPLGDLTEAVRVPQTVRRVVDNWAMHLQGYRQWEGENRRTRWHRFGCGNFSVGSGETRVEKRVANTKELPGLDRTDDIKKGAAQLLKFSRFKFDCRTGALRSVLMGNTYAETHANDYIEPVVRLHVTRADDPNSKAEWIFDAVVALTVNRFNAPDLADLFAFERLVHDV